MIKFDTKRRLIFYYLKGSIFYFILSAVFSTLVSFLDLVSPKIISFVVDSIIGSETPELSPFAMRLVAMGGGISTLRMKPLILALAAAAVGICAAFCRYCFRSFNARGAEHFVERMRNELFHHILYLPYTWLSQNSTGDIIQRCTSDVQTIKRFVSEQLTALVRTIILIILAVAFMAGINQKIMLVCIAFIPIVVGYSLFFHSRIGSAFRKADIEEGRLSAIAQENLTGVRVVRAFGRELYERERFETQNESYSNYWIHLFRLMSAFWTSGDVLTCLQVLTVVIIGSVFCVQGQLTAGEFIALNSYNLMLTWPVRMLGRVISEMSKAGISLERLRYIMNSKPETHPDITVPIPENGEIIFDHVTFSYDNNPDGAEAVHEVLSDVSFHILPGETIGILGGIGSGKSTLMYLLERLYELPADSGRITIGGIDIAQMKASDLRAYIGIVLQEPYLFSRSIAENIGFALDDADPEKIREAARTACVHDTIEGFEKGYDTFVGERGVTLSGGQKQRVAIAQMLIRQTPVMIFDDSLSAVDARTDAMIRHALREKTKNSTVLLISHRITTIMHADRILVLDKGKLTEEGTHEELIRKGGLYSRIYGLQTAVV